MSANTEDGHRSRRTILFAVAAAVVVGLIVGIGTVALLRHSGTGTANQQTTPPAGPSSATLSSVPFTRVVSSTSSAAPASQSQPAPSTTRTADPVTGKLPDGCLGGPEAHQAVLAAQTQAPLDNYGAAAFARTFARWTLSYPVDPNAAAVITSITAPGSDFGKTAVSDLKSAAQKLSTAGYTSASILPNQGQYRIIGGVIGTYAKGQRDGAEVQIQLYRELTGPDGQSSDTKFTADLLLAIVNSHWYVSGSLPLSWSVPADDTSIAWQPFMGAC